jgi:tetratricopeptide (TPR) repeat protein
VADEEGTGRWQHGVRPPGADDDPIRALRAGLAQIRAAPWDEERRRQLRAVAAEHGVWDQLALLLGEEVAAAGNDDVVAAAMLAELADAHENLDQPKETIAALEHLVDVVADDVLVHDRLARLYHRVGDWMEAAAAFERVGALARDDRGRAALRAAARIYRDHDELARAVTLYRTIIGKRPTDREAWRALDELLAELGRWREVSEVRGELAALTKDPIERASTLRAQARALERAGDAVGAATLLAESAGLAPEAVSGVIDYAEILAAGGRGREAAELLEQRVQGALDAGAPGPEIAALRLRLALVLDETGDAAGAGRVLDELLADAPDHAPALERAAARTARGDDRRAHAEALLRYAPAIAEPAARAAVLVEAGRLLRETGDRDAAVRALDGAAALVPDDADLARERDATRAAVAIDRAVGLARGGDAAAAERELRAVIAAAPANLDGVVALAELLAAAGRHAECAEHLRATLADHADAADAERRAELVHRYAMAVAALGEADSAHQLLYEAHRLDRRNLVITLALGESCFARKLWREAGIHLGGLANHPEAARHATAVAAGLVHAAQACVRGLRPADAEAHYAAAARIDAACTAAWHGLAQIATERGDLEGAAVYLEREAEAAPAGERLRLYTALGELALDVLGDAARAERCWAAVADVAPAPVLAKLLALQRKRGADLPRAETCRRLAALAANAAAQTGVQPPLARRTDLLVEATDAFAAAGDVAQARACADELMTTAPLEVDAVATASAIALAAGDANAIIVWLSRALAAWDAAGDTGDGDPRRAELWRRLGDARRARGDAKGARPAYKRAVAAAPESDGAQAARRALVETGGPGDEEAAQSLADLVAAEHDPGDVLRWARRCAQSGDPGARPLFELARALGATLDPTDNAIVLGLPSRTMASDETYAAVLPADERHALVDDPADAPFAPVLEALGEAAALVYPSAAAALAAAGFAHAERVSSASRTAVAAMFPPILKALDGPTLVVFTAPDAPDVRLYPASPPVVLLGARFAAPRARSRSDADLRVDAEQRFRLGRIVELARDRRLLAASYGAGPDGFARVVDTIWAAFAPGAAAPPEVAGEAERMRAAVPLLLRRRLGEMLAAIGRGAVNPAAYLAGCERAADRSGLLACGDVGVALSLAATIPRHLVELAATPRFHAARAALWAPLRR